MHTSRCYTVSRGRRSQMGTRENRKLLAKAKIKHPFPFLRSTDDIPAAGVAAFFCSMRAHTTIYLPVSPKIDRRAPPRGRARALEVAAGQESGCFFSTRLLCSAVVIFSSVCYYFRDESLRASAPAEAATACLTPRPPGLGGNTTILLLLLLLPVTTTTTIITSHQYYTATARWACVPCDCVRRQCVPIERVCHRRVFVRASVCVRVRAHRRVRVFPYPPADDVTTTSALPFSTTTTTATTDDPTAIIIIITIIYLSR